MPKQHREYVFVIFVGLIVGVLGVSGILALIGGEAPTEHENPLAGSSSRESYLERDRPTPSSPSKGVSSQFVPTKLDEIVFPLSAFDRKLSIVSWVATLSNDQLLGWLKQSTDPSWSVDRAIREELQSVLLRRLADLAPEKTLDFVSSLKYDEREFMATIVLFTWARTDLDKTVSYFKNVKNQSTIRWIPSILRAQDNLNLNQMRELAQALGDESYAFSVHLERLVPAKIENPRNTWIEIVSTMDREDIRNLVSESLNRVAIALVKEEGLAALEEIESYFSKLAFYDVLYALLSDKPGETVDYVLDNLSERGEEFIQYEGIRILAQNDPAGLLARIEVLLDLEFHTEFEREHTIDAIYTAAENSPRQLLEVFNVLPQQYKLGAIYRALENLEPNEATDFIMNLSEPALKGELASRFFWHWSRQNLDEARNWVINLPEHEPERSALMRSLAQALVSTKPREAFQIALEQPPVEPQPFHGWTGESAILISISRNDVDLAVQLLPMVRDIGDNRIHAYCVVGDTLIKNGETKKAIALGNQLSSEEQVEYYQDIARTWVSIDPQGLYHELTEFPSDNIKSEVAGLMVRYASANSDVYSTEKLAQLNKYILKEDRDTLNE